MPIDMEKIAREKMPLVTETPIDCPPQQLPALKVYQALVGDIDTEPARGTRHPSFYHQISSLESRAKFWYWTSGLTFFFLVTAQIVFCLSISIGAQMGFSMNAISIAAGINTLVAAGVAALKGLGLPEKKAIERYQLRKIMEQVEFTTRRLQAGLIVDAEKAAEEARNLQRDVEDQAQVFQKVGDSALLVPEKTK